MGYKFIEDDTKPFINTHNGANHLQRGLLTWSEGNGSLNGIKATIASDPNTFYTDDRIFMCLLSNDLNLMFNLDRTLYVSKKGTNDGMMTTPTGEAKINHFNSLSNAILDLDNVYPVNNSTNFWSDGDFDNTNGLYITIGAGIYDENIDVLKTLSQQPFPIHVCGYGNNTILRHTSVSSNLNWNGTGVCPSLLLENITIDKLNTGELNSQITFKNVKINTIFDKQYFKLTNCEKFNGDITFNDAKAIFTGTKGWTLYKDIGIGTYIGEDEKQYVGESTE